MTPEQLRESYRAVHLRTVAIAAETDLLMDIEKALDAYALSQGYDLAAIVDPVIEQPVSLPAGSNGAAEDSRPVAVAPAAPIDAPDSPPAAGEVEDGAPGRGNGHAPSGSGPSSPPPTNSVCPHCGFESLTTNGTRIHVGRMHKDRPALATVSAEPLDDPRVIDEDCRKCGQRFTWRPALVNHERTCRGEGLATA